MNLVLSAWTLNVELLNFGNEKLIIVFDENLVTENDNLFFVSIDYEKQVKRKGV